MSSKAKKITQTLTDGNVPESVKIVKFKVHFNIDGVLLYTVVSVSGVPESVEDNDPTIKYAAEQMFVNALNSRMWLEVYLPEQDPTAVYPHFKNLSKQNDIEVIDVEKI